jgi:hypothetical protein
VPMVPGGGAATLGRSAPPAPSPVPDPGGLLAFLVSPDPGTWEVALLQFDTWHEPPGIRPGCR